MLKSDRTSDQRNSQISSKDKPPTPPWLAQQEDDVIDSDCEGTNAKDLAKDSGKAKQSSFSQTWSELKKPTAYKPFLLLMVTFTLQQSTGTFAIIFYAVNVFKASSIDTITAKSILLISAF